MPGIDGIEASRRIKNLSKTSGQPKIIMATAYGRQEIMHQAERVGLDGFLIKPVNPSVMLNTIMEVFGKEVQKGPRFNPHNDINEEAIGRIKGARILLVEDNEINQQVAREILSGANLEVTLADNGQEAVAAVQENQFEAVLMDIQMPVMDGYEATRKIREWEGGIGNTEVGMRNKIEKKSDLTSKIPDPKSQIQKLPIIAMTAHAMAGDREKSLATGMNDHVAKPINPQELFSTLLKWVKPASQKDDARRPGAEALINSAPKDPDDFQVPSPDKKDDDLPLFLPGFDLKSGLKRLQGNRRLYRKLLLDFGRSYREASDNIHRALIANDIKQVHSLVHNIKGLAGNLSANRLQEAATQMDSAVKKALSAEESVPEQLDSGFDELKAALEEALTSCQTIDQSDDVEVDPSDKDPVVSLPPDLARRTADRLHEAADMGDINGLKQIAQELKTESESYSVISEQIIQLAEDFDFDGVIDLADKLVTQTKS